MTGKPKFLQLGHFWSTWKPLIRTRNPQMGQKQQQPQQQQQPFRHRPQMLSTKSNCHLGGNSEAWRLTLGTSWHPSSHGRMRQLHGFCCPSWATGSHQHHHPPEQKQRQRQQQQHQRRRPDWPIHAQSLWPQRQSQMHMGASAVLLLLATTHLMHIWGISTSQSATIMPPLPWPWQRQQQQQHKHKHNHQLEEEEQQQQRRGISSRWSTDKAG
ncbi:hypothetical protein ACLKA6_012874 [Drosophila palustris]